jgi:hypothetical protein
LLEDRIDRQQDTPELLHRFGIVRRVHPILIEGNRIRYVPDFYDNPRRSMFIKSR